MIWRLFKPRPIVKISLPGKLTPEDYKIVYTDLQTRMGKEYIVLVVPTPDEEVNVEIIR
jgi:hypothetical protein